MDCGAIMQQLLSTAKCAAKAQPTFDNAPKAAGGDCASAQAAIGQFDPECCPGLRELTTSVSAFRCQWSGVVVGHPYSLGREPSVLASLNLFMTFTINMKLPHRNPLIYRYGGQHVREAQTVDHRLSFGKTSY